MQYQLVFKRWIEDRPYWQFFVILYLLRWLVLIPIVLISPEYESLNIGSLDSMSTSKIIVLSLYMIIIGPLIETFIECFLPFKILKYLQTEVFRSWIFIVTSGLLMTVLHPIGAAIPSFITGVFLAYNYLHSSNKKQSFAFLTTTLFHSLINIVGVSFIFYNRI